MLQAKQLAAMQDALLAERRKQYEEDHKAVLDSLSLHEWRKFVLRWGLSPPPGGWNDEPHVLGVMHKSRLVLKNFSDQQRLESAQYCVANNIPLPGSMTLIDGVLHEDENVVEDNRPFGGVPRPN